MINETGSHPTNEYVMNLNSAKKSDRLRFMLAGLKSAGVSMIYQDVDLAIQFAANLPVNWPGEDEVHGLTDAAFLSERNASKVLNAKRQVLTDGDAATLEILREEDGERHWYMFKIEPDIDADGGIKGLFTTVLDIDDLKYREMVLKTLLRELSHRSKNLLAIIQSVASQTARSSQNLDDFLFSFRNRVQSMAQSQDLVTASDWRGAELFELTQSQLKPLVGDLPAGFSMKGTDAYLFPNAALHIGLALHELTIDSLAHGALGPAGGEVVLSAELCRTEENEDELVVTWSEHFASPVSATNRKAPEKADFARTVLNRIVPQALSAEFRHETGDEQLIYQLHIPDTQYETCRNP